MFRLDVNDDVNVNIQSDRRTSRLKPFDVKSMQAYSFVGIHCQSANRKLSQGEHARFFLK